MNLLVDIGNSRLKWGIAVKDAIAYRGVLTNEELDRVCLFRAWQQLPRPSSVAVVCVAAERVFALVEAVVRDLWAGINLVRPASEARAYGVTNAYARPEKLGVDRWLALLAARHYYPLPVCIADCGTAITVDWIDRHGMHLGGVICPGLTLMRRSLSAGTEALTFDSSCHPAGLANCTEAAVFNGVVNAASGLIERVYGMSNLGGALLLTGGDAELIAACLASDAVIDTDLVLRGLAVVLAETV